MRSVFVVSLATVNHDSYEVYQEIKILNTWQEAMKVRNEIVCRFTPKGYIIDELNQQDCFAPIVEQYYCDSWVRIEKVDIPDVV